MLRLFPLAGFEPPEMQHDGPRTPAPTPTRPRLPSSLITQPCSLCFLFPFLSSTHLLHFCKFVLRSLYQRSRGLLRDTNYRLLFF